MHSVTDLFLQDSKFIEIFFTGLNSYITILVLHVMTTVQKNILD